MDTTARLNGLVSRLREQGNRITPQRLAILKALVEHEGHPTVEQLHREVAPAFPTTSLATVYKTIHLLKTAHEVLELNFGEYGSRYDGRRPFPHPHLICTRCNAISDPEVKGVEDLVESLVRQSGFRVDSHRFDLFGLCPSCRAEK